MFMRWVHFGRPSFTLHKASYLKKSDQISRTILIDFNLHQHFQQHSLGRHFVVHLWSIDVVHKPTHAKLYSMASNSTERPRLNRIHFFFAFALCAEANGAFSTGPSVDPHSNIGHEVSLGMGKARKIRRPWL